MLNLPSNGEISGTLQCQSVLFSSLDPRLRPRHLKDFVFVVGKLGLPIFEVPTSLSLIPSPKHPNFNACLFQSLFLLFLDTAAAHIAWFWQAESQGILLTCVMLSHFLQSSVLDVLGSCLLALVAQWNPQQLLGLLNESYNASDLDVSGSFILIMWWIFAQNNAWQQQPGYKIAAI